eukprot:8971453-Pyramimonas_sp.AAC.1
MAGMGGPPVVTSTSASSGRTRTDTSGRISACCASPGCSGHAVMPWSWVGGGVPSKGQRQGLARG